MRFAILGLAITCTLWISSSLLYFIVDLDGCNYIEFARLFYRITVVLVDALVAWSRVACTESLSAQLGMLKFLGNSLWIRNIQTFPFNEKQFSDRIRMENGPLYRYKPYGSTSCVIPLTLEGLELYSNSP